MYSLKELYKIGNGPSSSHTMGPKIATLKILEKYKTIDHIKVTLYGSLAFTGKGHLTDYIIKRTLKDIDHEIIFNYDEVFEHPNTLKYSIYENNTIIDEVIIYSVGGGSIEVKGQHEKKEDRIYDLLTFNQIKEYCKKNNLRLYEYVYQKEPYIKDFLKEVLEIMLRSINNGLKKNDILPGELEVTRKARRLYEFNDNKENLEAKERRILCAYAYAVAEENASGRMIVTAPTCGASGILPAVVKHYMDKNLYQKKQIINAIASAGLIGNLTKENASISGAEAGCQAEVGTACAMAAAFISELLEYNIDKLENAIEIALEHHLGLTCDPIKGYVQIPCIERNAVAAMRAVDACLLAGYLNEEENKISFDMVLKTMKETGLDMCSGYKETSKKGLAKHFNTEE